MRHSRTELSLSWNSNRRPLLWITHRTVLFVSATKTSHGTAADDNWLRHCNFMKYTGGHQIFPKHAGHGPGGQFHFSPFAGFLPSAGLLYSFPLRLNRLHCSFRKMSYLTSNHFLYYTYIRGGTFLLFIAFETLLFTVIEQD